MKKVLFVCLFALFTVLSYAQRPQGHISIIPKVGLDIANLSGNEIYYLNSQNSSQQKSMKSKYNTRFAGGVDVEYQILPMSSISLGAFYSQQGCRFPDCQMATDKNTNVAESHQLEGFEKYREKLDYIQVPLLFNQYVAEGLAVKVGVQMGFLTSAKVSYTLNEITLDKDGTVTSEIKTNMETDIKKTLRTTDLTLDLRYNFGIKSIYKEKDMPNEKNNFLLFTVGYRLN